MISDEDAKARKKRLNATPKAKAARVFERQWKSAVLRDELTITGCTRCPLNSTVRAYAIPHFTGDILQTTWMCWPHKKKHEAQMDEIDIWNNKETPTGDIFDELEY